MLHRRTGRVVAQVGDDGGRLYAVKLDNTPGAFDADVSGNATLAAIGLPVPEIVAHRPGPPAVLVLRWIEGDPISASSPRSAQRHAGRLLRQVHRLPGGPPFSGQPTIEGWITAWTDSLAGWWAGADGSAEQVGRLRRWVADLCPLLADRPASQMLFDGRADHVLVRSGRVAGIIDLHDLGSGDPAMDLAVLTSSDEALLPGVLDGYRPTAVERGELDQLIPFYRLLRRLAAAEWESRF